MFCFLLFSFFITGIFAYLNYLTPKSRGEILDLLVNGLKRLEYRGYDSTGVAIDGPNAKDTVMVKSVGKVKVLEDAIAKSIKYLEIHRKHKIDFILY